MSDENQAQPAGVGRAGESDGPRDERAGGEAGGGAGRERGAGGGRHGRRRRRDQQPSQHQQSPSPRRPEPSLNMEELRDLAELFTSHGLTDFEFENAEIRVRLSRNTVAEQQQQAGTAAPTSAPTPASTASAGGDAAAEAPASGGAAGAATGAPRAEDLHIITSPIVGTFYRSPSPDAEPFVRVGSRVEPGTVVCIIEAMKLMNEILAETSGVVEKIYVENKQPVEYGHQLFGIKK